jgi:thioredoxin 1
LKKLITFAKKLIMVKLSVIILSVILFVSCNNPSGKTTDQKQVQASTVAESELNAPMILTDETFKTKVFDYSTGKEWKYVGDKPCIIDFYADWCGPCKRLAPILDELANEYKGQIYIYKVNTDNSQNVSAFFNIDGIPATFLIPMSGEPRTMVGLYPKEEYVKGIQEVLLKKSI